MLSMRQSAAGAFTLVELLVVVAIVGILVALLLPAVGAARESARRAQCSNNFKQVTLALLNFESAQGELPIGQELWLPAEMDEGACGPPNDPLRTGIFFGWATSILPNLEAQALHDRFDQSLWSVAWNDNYEPSGAVVQEFVCPSDAQQVGYAFTGAGSSFQRAKFGTNHGKWGDSTLTNIVGVADSEDWLCVGAWPKSVQVTDGAMGANAGLPLRAVTDGQSATFVLAEVTGGGEASHAGHIWIANAMTDTRDGINGPFTVPGGLPIHTGEPTSGGWFSYRDTGPSSHHPGGAHFARLDGSVHFHTQDMESDVVTALTTRAGIDVVTSR